MNYAQMSAAILSSLLLCSCATDTGKVAARSAAQCAVGEPTTGTIVVRREQCVEVTEESREAARRLLERMQQEQERARTASKQRPG